MHCTLPLGRPRWKPAAQFLSPVRRQRHLRHRARRFRPWPQLDALRQRHARWHELRHDQAGPHRPGVPDRAVQYRLVEHAPRDLRREPADGKTRGGAHRRRLGRWWRLARAGLQPAQGRLHDHDLPSVEDHGDPARGRVPRDPEADREDDTERTAFGLERRTHLQHARRPDRRRCAPSDLSVPAEPDRRPHPRPEAAAGEAVRRLHAAWAPCGVRATAAAPRPRARRCRTGFRSSSRSTSTSRSLSGCDESRRAGVSDP